ncbi:LysR family transcriptional regulator [Acrocarpospora corrugata]|uniref:LysR family transcriptional regulator n=1 Tax=Acrocarpospora corrugata TaxID=35763 RepID=A0A5M3W0Q4_9ACTN|nr:LysR substrate-binding domain-containing protein [Acrocarpospora corrugata]GES02615.1 LysR family transcriptional regulator [Acrocarpospora corrugata]
MDLRLLRYFVAVAEELHFGRAAARLHMTQPPLSRAIKQLETDLGAVLLHRSPAGVTLTAAGAALYDEARTLLEQADRVRHRVAAAAGAATLTIGTLGDSAEQVGTRLAAAYRERHPAVHIRVREADFTDPTTGLRAGLVDVALTRTPFDDTGITTHLLRSDPVGVVLRTDDPLAGRDTLSLGDLAGRRWFRLPDGADPIWCAYWNATTPGGPQREGPVVRTVHECLQGVLWNGAIGLTPLTHALPEGLTSVPLLDMPPSCLVVAHNSDDGGPLIRSFVHIAASVYSPGPSSRARTRPASGTPNRR